MATAVAPVKTELALPRRKWHREIAPALEDLGFHFLGLDASSHAIFQHKVAGQVRLASTPSGSLDENKKQAIARARRLLAVYESEGQMFLIHLRDLFHVMPHEVKTVRINLLDEARAWIKHSHSKQTPHNLTSLLRDSPYIELVGSGGGKGKSQYLIWGSDALSEAAQKDVADPGDRVDTAVAEIAKQSWMNQIQKKGGPIAWLANYLADGKAHPTLDVLEAWNGSEHALKEAMRDLGVIVERESKFQGRGLWRLPLAPDLAKEAPASGRKTTEERIIEKQRPPEHTPGEQLSAGSIRAFILAAAADGDLGEEFKVAEVLDWFEEHGYTLPSYPSSDNGRRGSTAVRQNMNLLRQEKRLKVADKDGRTVVYGLVQPPKPVTFDSTEKLDAEIMAIKEGMGLAEPKKPIEYEFKITPTGSLSDQIRDLENRAARVDEAEAKVALLAEELVKAEQVVAECTTALAATAQTIKELRNLV